MPVETGSGSVRNGVSEPTTMIRPLCCSTTNTRSSFGGEPTQTGRSNVPIFSALNVSLSPLSGSSPVAAGASARVASDVAGAAVVSPRRSSPPSFLAAVTASRDRQRDRQRRQRAEPPHATASPASLTACRKGASSPSVNGPNSA